MEVQLQPVQVFEHPQPDPAHGPLGDPTEDGVPQLAEEYPAKAQKPVDQQKGDGQYQFGLQASVHTINDMLERPGHGQRCPFGGQQCRNGQDHPTFEVPEVGPEITPYLPQVQAGYAGVSRWGWSVRAAHWKLSVAGKLCAHDASLGQKNLCPRPDCDAGKQEFKMMENDE